MKVRVGGGATSLASLRVRIDEIHSSAFSFNITTGLSSAALSATPDLSTALRGLCRLSQNGVEGWGLTDAPPAEPKTWRLLDGVIDLFGDVTGPDWSLFRVSYPSSP